MICILKFAPQRIGNRRFGIRESFTDSIVYIVLELFKQSGNINVNTSCTARGYILGKCVGFVKNALLIVVCLLYRIGKICLSRSNYLICLILCVFNHCICIGICFCRNLGKLCGVYGTAGLLCFLKLCGCLLFICGKLICHRLVFILKSMKLFLGLCKLASFVKYLLSAFEDLCVKLGFFLFDLCVCVFARSFVLHILESSFQFVVFLFESLALFVMLYYVSHNFGFVEAERRCFEFAVCGCLFFLVSHYVTP